MTAAPSPVTADAAGSDDLDPAASQFLTFWLGERVFAVGIEAVREIIQYGQMTLVPRTPSFVRGVINLRGSVVPVIDLQARLGRGRAEVGEKTCIVIFEAHRQTSHQVERVELGLMVDAVSEVIDIDAAQVEPAPPFGSAVGREFIRGVVRRQERFITLLETGHALDIEALATLCDQEQERLAA
ncbi:chemotaxis protein CheW [Leptothrix discophora]|uniref:Chemotaxis protein CheW n=1 Tax=Leptothrix discophora TaxID=89 RepID=A0ABT9G0H2_LEPDI|nr:chemotaxis protein CheW [Leptothrix discophora]MDP4299980.1 chemotaxis protein CheW [Leptothrix discophora]